MQAIAHNHTVGGITIGCDFLNNQLRGAHRFACHGGRVKIRSLTLLFSTLLGSFGCEDGGPAFMSLDELCVQHAESVCSAREACCEAAPSRTECEAAEQSNCVALRDAKAKPASYDSAHAAQVRADELAVLDRCGAPFSVGRFFDGVSELGDACESNAQCASDRCDLEQGLCVRNEQLLLCPVSETSE
jgi:hypothetical protein